MQVGQLMLELDQGMIGAGDVAGAAGAGAGAGGRFDHGADDLGVLAHAEIIVGAPDHDIALALGRVPHGMGKPAGEPLQIGEDAIAPLVMQTVEGGTEELIVIHRKSRTEPERNRLRTGAFLELFQVGCRGANLQPDHPLMQN